MTRASRRAAAAGGGQGRQGARLAGSGLHGAHLPGARDGGADDLGDRLQAPLEQPANPGYAPNPAKAPWYFLGLQEMLVYFDPWMAASSIRADHRGLAAMPFIELNPKGNGYFTVRESPLR
jgi:hypothetical protein